MGKFRVLPDSVVDRDTVVMDGYHRLFILQQKPYYAYYYFTRVLSSSSLMLFVSKYRNMHALVMKTSIATETSALASC
jgi:hypothetical protein